ncbi:hypothetical protein KIW84_052358 [Lathyrus oleraceus]|uniref:Uncharacterized protein n=1 Tax=Pisum sativum TaxID=3888 RepID=A0A9D4WPL3_PEA|nr:hypothetical protein KIW84_052358 [Pisum sativum]
MDQRYYNTGRRSLAEVISVKEADFQQFKKKYDSLIIMRFSPNEEELSRFQKVFIEIVENLGITYRMQYIFHVEGYFSVKVTPLGANLSMLEEKEEGELNAFLKEASSWLGQWFK